MYTLFIDNCCAKNLFYPFYDTERIFCYLPISNKGLVPYQLNCFNVIVNKTNCFFPSNEEIEF